MRQSAREHPPATIYATVPAAWNWTTSKSRAAFSVIQANFSTLPPSACHVPGGLQAWSKITPARSSTKGNDMELLNFAVLGATCIRSNAHETTPRREECCTSIFFHGSGFKPPAGDCVARIPQLAARP